MEHNIAPALWWESPSPIAAAGSAYDAAAAAAGGARHLQQLSDSGQNWCAKERRARAPSPR